MNVRKSAMRQSGLHLERAISRAMRGTGGDALAERKTAGLLPAGGKNARGSDGTGIGKRGKATMGISEMNPEEAFAYALWLENGAGEVSFGEEQMRTIKTLEALHAFREELKR